MYIEKKTQVQILYFLLIFIRTHNNQKNSIRLFDKS